VESAWRQLLLLLLLLLLEWYGETFGTFV